MLMSRGHFRHLPVSGDASLVGMLDITDVCRGVISSFMSTTIFSVPGIRRRLR